MRVTTHFAGCPAPVAPLPPQVSPRSATFSMARSVTFSMAIDTDGTQVRSIRVTWWAYPPPPPGLRPVPRNFATRLSRSNQNGAPTDTAAAVNNHLSTCAIQPPAPQSGNPSSRPHGSSPSQPSRKDARMWSGTRRESALSASGAAATACWATA